VLAVSFLVMLNLKAALLAAFFCLSGVPTQYEEVCNAYRERCGRAFAFVSETKA